MHNSKLKAATKLLGYTIALTLLGLSTQAQASGMACGDRTSLLKALSDKYKEAPRALGLSSSGNAMFEVYTSKKGTWTILMTTTKGVTCIMAAGHSWEEALEIAEGPQV
ncbi:hypothetical protein [Hoeflea prorocentri]|uniref:Uncharacterized protein n=1 Tax=Hoeflea prorocentri TaxID=1922333 RepID=A0A9X3ZJE0_9HYPH|nr:hypothetical protein [Hoeflea prorocentri]MCY6382993.1 hypothetical protein [Hoeflea prorocentri]MDA5400793.1 hypothetical protein [Hoeflea prorocentri]